MKKTEETHEYRKCEVCGKDFYTLKRSSQRFCSDACQIEWQKTNTGFANKKFQGGYAICDNCGKEFVLGHYRLSNQERHFCCKECRKQWYSNVWSQSDNWREESRKRAVKILNENPVITMTKPQRAVNQILDSLGIKYRNEEPFTYYSMDNFLYEYKLPIEVMGDYWHSNPNKYTKERLNDKQKYIISRDKAKRTYLHNYYNMPILYLWEADINKQPSLCAELIKTYIENCGELRNYNSFNYCFDKNGKITLNEEIIETYQEQNAC